MNEPKLILNVLLDKDGQMTVNLGTRHEALLALALRKAALTIDNVILETEYEVRVKDKPMIEIPKTILDKI